MTAELEQFPVAADTEGRKEKKEEKKERERKKTMFQKNATNQEQAKNKKVLKYLDADPPRSFPCTDF